MLLSANGRPASLLQVAAEVTGQTCSANPDASRCNVAIDPELALKHYGLGYQATSDDIGSLDANFFRLHIVDNQKPVEVWWMYTGARQGGHVALVTGYDPPSDSWCLLDPKRSPCWVVSDVLQSYFGQARLFKAFYDIGGALG